MNILTLGRRAFQAEKKQVQKPWGRSVCFRARKKGSEQREGRLVGNEGAARTRGDTRKALPGTGPSHWQGSGFHSKPGEKPWGGGAWRGSVAAEARGQWLELVRQQKRWGGALAHKQHHGSKKGVARKHWGHSNYNHSVTDDQTNRRWSEAGLSQEVGLNSEISWGQYRGPQYLI